MPEVDIITIAITIIITIILIVIIIIIVILVIVIVIVIVPLWSPCDPRWPATQTSHWVLRALVDLTCVPTLDPCPVLHNGFKTTLRGRYRLVFPPSKPSHPSAKHIDTLPLRCHIPANPKNTWHIFIYEGAPAAPRCARRSPPGHTRRTFEPRRGKMEGGTVTHAHTCELYIACNLWSFVPFVVCNLTDTFLRSSIDTKQSSPKHETKLYPKLRRHDLWRWLLSATFFVVVCFCVIVVVCQAAAPSLLSAR